MNKWIVISVLLCFISLQARADVTNEVNVGVQGASSVKVTDAGGTDNTDKMEIRHSRLSGLYTHFFSPLRDDEKPMELRRFYQHPSSINIGLESNGYSQRDSRVPIAVQETKRGVGLLLLGGELYLSTNTGFFLNVGGGSGKEKITVAGVDLPETDIKVNRTDFGVQQYIGPEFRMHLRFHGESLKSTPAGQTRDTSERGVVYFGVRGVIRDTLSLAAEIGGGELKEEAGSSIRSDIGAVNLEGAVYVGKALAFRLAIEAETVKRTTPPEQTTKWARMTLDARYWFSERVGLVIPLTSETTKVDGQEQITSSGFGIYGNFRF
jgi:hypothetical protein